MRAFPALPLLAAALLASACAGPSSIAPSSSIILRASGGRVAAAAPVDLELWNRSDQPLGYNACVGLILERREGDGWARVSHQPPGTACTLQLDVLQPGASMLLRVPRLPTMTAGTYRAHLQVEWPLGDGKVEASSPEFTVEGGA